MNKRILCIDERLEILDLVRNILCSEFPGCHGLREQHPTSIAYQP